MYQQFFTLAGIVIGGALGLLSPLVTARLTDREKSRDVQRQVASEIMALFEDGQSPQRVFTPSESPPRRRLYLLAQQLEDERPRDSCLRFIAYAGNGTVEDGRLDEAWENMITEIGMVYRRSRRGG